MTQALRLAIIGDPVDHSRSPALHRALLSQTKRAGTYDAIRVAAGDGARAIEALRAAGYMGLNVTTPLKEEAFAFAAVRDAAAATSGSANTLVLGATVAAFDTDGAGARGALAAAGLGDVAGRVIVVLGTGPTARACANAFARAGARTLVWSRTPGRAAAVAGRLGCEPWSPAVELDAAFSTLPPQAQPADVALVAALRSAPVVVDANYGSRATLGSFLDRAVHDGEAMLRASARASFQIFSSARRDR